MQDLGFPYALTIILVLCLPILGQDNNSPQCAWSTCDATHCEGSYPYLWAKGTCGIFGCTSSLYCCEVPSPYIDTYWVGTAVFCGASCSDCRGNDECIIPSNPCGDGQTCWTGSKTLCGELNPLEQLQEIPWYYFVVGAVVLIVVGLLAVGGVTCYCCKNGKCCD